MLKVFLRQTGYHSRSCFLSNSILFSLAVVSQIESWRIRFSFSTSLTRASAPTWERWRRDDIVWLRCLFSCSKPFSWRADSRGLNHHLKLCLNKQLRVEGNWFTWLLVLHNTHNEREQKGFFLDQLHNNKPGGYLRSPCGDNQPDGNSWSNPRGQICFLSLSSSSKPDLTNQMVRLIKGVRFGSNSYKVSTDTKWAAASGPQTASQSIKH